MSKILTKAFIDRLKQKAKKLKERDGLGDEEKEFYDDIILFIEDFYDHMESSRWQDGIQKFVIIIGTLVIAFSHR